MANKLTIENRTLKAQWTDGDNAVSEQVFKHINPEATAAQMDAFFAAISPLTKDTLSYKGYEDVQDLTQE